MILKPTVDFVLDRVDLPAVDSAKPLVVRSGASPHDISKPTVEVSDLPCHTGAFAMAWGAPGGLTTCVIGGMGRQAFQAAISGRSTSREVCRSVR